MNILAIDTATSVLSAALKTGPHEIIEKKLDGFLTHAENLLPLIDQLLKKEKIRIGDVDAFLIDRGPGSFTGLRIGYATLKGFLAVKKKDCYGALSLDIIASRCEVPEGARLAVCLNAFRQKIYTRFYRNQKGILSAVKTPRVLTFEELASAVPDGVYLAGDALVRFQKDFEALCRKKNARILPRRFWYPAASAMIDDLIRPSRGASRRSFLEKFDKPRDFLPLYFRLSEAEEKGRKVKA